MVGMEPETKHFIPLTIPIPATMLAQGEDPDCWYPAKTHSSRNGVSGSRRSFIRSLAVCVSNQVTI